MAQPIETNHECEPIAFHVYKSLTGKVVLSEPILPGRSIPFGSDCFTETSVECDQDGEIYTVKKIKGRDEIISTRLVTKPMEKFNLFGISPREEIVFKKP